MVITEDIILFKLIKQKLTKLIKFFMNLRNLFTIVLVAFATILTAQTVVRPLQIIRCDAVESQKLTLRKGVFTSKALTIDSTAKSSQIPSALAVYNYVNLKASNETYTIVTDTVNASVTAGTTVYNFGASQVTYTVTLPATPNNGDIVWLLFNKNVTTLTVSGGTNTVGGTALTAATGGTTVASYIYIGGAVDKWFRRD